jgi:hypothetical protein
MSNDQTIVTADTVSTVVLEDEHRVVLNTGGSKTEANERHNTWIPLVGAEESQSLHARGVLVAEVEESQDDLRQACLSGARINDYLIVRS